MKGRKSKEMSKNIGVLCYDTGKLLLLIGAMTDKITSKETVTCLESRILFSVLHLLRVFLFNFAK